MNNNNLEFLLEIIKKLDASGIKTWVFGGWAEELLGMIEPRKHNDIDLLYPASDFLIFEKFVAEHSDIHEIAKKKFIHKRVFLYKAVMVELLLLQKERGELCTNFFGLYKFIWPSGVLKKSVIIKNQKINIADRQSLLLYKKDYYNINYARIKSGMCTVS